MMITMTTTQTLYPPTDFDITIDCPYPCGEPIRFVGTHSMNALHTKHCPKCGNRHVWRSDWIYPPNYSDGVWLCYRLEGMEPITLQKPKGFWRTLLGI